MNEQQTNDKGVVLLQRIAEGDRSALAEFYDSYAPLLFSIASRILRDPGEAEDVLQETFIHIWEKADKFDPKLGKVSSWAVVLARNRAIDRIRASKRRIRLAKVFWVERAAVADGEEMANGTVYGHEKAKMIHSALLRLAPEQYRAIELAFFSGLTQNEISEILQEPLGTIKARIRRGMLNLRDRLEEHLSEGSCCPPFPLEPAERIPSNGDLPQHKKQGRQQARNGLKRKAKQLTSKVEL